MAENATILIPDISGYTEFLSKTELVHSSHIINELLEAILAANGNEFVLSEVEGDALLLFRKGTPLEPDALVAQCVAMFESFHRQLKVIERDSLCQCGACKTASNLSLKFVAHHGAVQEIKVLHFTKCSGIDMVVAHRLLKNQVESDEYILATQSCFVSSGLGHAPGALAWKEASDEYPAIGSIRYQYAALDAVKKAIPEPAPRPNPVLDLGKYTLAVEIDAPMLAIYQLVIDLDQRTRWMAGEERVDRPPTTERIGLRHVCLFLGLKVEWASVKAEIADDRILYVEDGLIVDKGWPARASWTFERTAQGKTLMTFRAKWLCDPEPPPEVMDMILADFRVSLETVKEICEADAGR
jgi:hypothetical protein